LLKNQIVRHKTSTAAARQQSLSTTILFTYHIPVSPTEGATICRLEVSPLKVANVDQMCGVLDGAKLERTGEEYTAESCLEQLKT